jgi:pyocin large subunit-like protein
MWGFVNVNYVGIILFTVLWTTTEQIMDLPLIHKKYENVVLPDKENVQTSNFKLHCMENPRALSIVSICAS